MQTNRVPWAMVTKNGYEGIVGMLRLDEVTGPLQRTMANHALTMADRGYFWMMYLPV